MKKILKKYNKIDVLIINAAIPYGGIFEMTKIDMIKKVFEINFFSQLPREQRYSAAASRDIYDQGL